MKTLFLGDVSPTKDTYDIYAAGDTALLFGDTRELFVGNDINMVNLECAITDAEEGIKKFGPCIKAPEKTAAVLKELGVNYVCLSNNHFFDFGKKGVYDSKKALDAVGLNYTGFGNNIEDSRRDLIVEKDGEKIAILCVCEHEYSYALEDRMGSRAFDEFETMLDIGSGRGVFLIPFMNEFPEVQVTALDLLDKRVTFLNELAAGGYSRLTAQNKNICDQPFPAGSFDVVTLLEVLEHIPEVDKAVAAAVRMARKYVVVSVPSKEDDNPEHIHLLTKDMLTKLFAAAGCTKLHFSGVNGHLIVIAAIE